MSSKNQTLLTDLYALTMMQGYHKTPHEKKEVLFDMFYRTNPSESSFAITCGLEQVIDYIKNLNFEENDIAYLKSLNIFENDFLTYLENFKFSGDVYAIPEGTVVFPMEPLLQIKAPIMEAQLVEAAILNIINHQSLIATKSARIAWAAQGDPILEFGLRRAQGPDAGVYGARAAVIGGCVGTSNVLSGQLFDIPVKGTHAHSWVMSFPNELEAFRAYAKQFPDNCILLVDTYNTLEQGVPNAIKCFQEMKDEGYEFKSYGIRLDSGDLAYISKEARKLLDKAGFKDAIISASGDLDEYLISSLKLQGSKIGLWGVGTKLITAEDCPAFGGVYKLAAETNEDGKLVPKIKLSNNPQKVTLPGVKKVLRIYDKETNKIKADLITLFQENFDENKDITLFDQHATWIQMRLKSGTYYIKELLVPIFKNGECVYSSPKVMEIREKAKNELSTLWDEHRRLDNPHTVPVDLSEKLFVLKEKLIRENQ